MAAPNISLTYPADNDVGIPIGEILYVDFDRGIDLSVARDHVVLYGPDRDLMTGPESAIWIDKQSGNDRYLLTSPGFKGLVPVDYELVYIDLVTGLEVPGVTITSEAEEGGTGSGGIGHRLKIIPQSELAADVQYVLHVLGDPDLTGKTGISSRTVFDVVPDVNNTSTTGIVHNYGGYKRNIDDTVVIEITTSGDVGIAKYKWYYLSEGANSARVGKVTTSRFRRLEDGLQIRFTGSGFIAGDVYRFNVEAIERMTSSIKVTFTTNDGTYTQAPDSPSTPATSEPPSSVLPASPTESLSDQEYLRVVYSDPLDGAYQMNRNKREFTIQFSENIDISTITNSSVRVWKYPVSGIFDGQPQIVELEKILEVSGDTLTIKI